MQKSSKIHTLLLKPLTGLGFCKKHYFPLEAFSFQVLDETVNMPTAADGESLAWIGGNGNNRTLKERGINYSTSGLVTFNGLNGNDRKGEVESAHKPLVSLRVRFPQYLREAYFFSQ